MAIISGALLRACVVSRLIFRGETQELGQSHMCPTGGIGKLASLQAKALRLRRIVRSPRVRRRSNSEYGGSGL